MNNLLPILPWLASGLILGVSAGLSPGPLTVLVVTQTLRFGLREGARVAVAPLLTDGPLIVLSSLLFWRVVLHSGAQGQRWLAAISLVGAVVLLWLAWQTARAPAPSLTGPASPGRTADPEPAPGPQHQARPHSVRTAVLTNLVNPHPYLFWLTIGGPMMVAAHRQSSASAAGWALGFFVGLVGAKLVLATLVDRVRARLSPRAWRLTMGVLALAMVGLSLGFVHRGLSGF